MKIDIKMNNGKWVANGKTYKELNHDEKKFMDEFFKEVKSTQKIMKSLIAIALLISFSSCSVSRNVKVIGFTDSSIITATNDTIPARERLIRLMEPNDYYHLIMLNDRCIDASWPSNKRKQKLNKSINQ